MKCLRILLAAIGLVVLVGAMPMLASAHDNGNSCSASGPQGGSCSTSGSNGSRSGNSCSGSGSGGGSCGANGGKACTAGNGGSCAARSSGAPQTHRQSEPCVFAPTPKPRPTPTLDSGAEPGKSGTTAPRKCR